MECTGVPDIITRVPIVERRKQKCQNQRRCDKGSRGKGGCQGGSTAWRYALADFANGGKGHEPKKQAASSSWKRKRDKQIPP